MKLFQFTLMIFCGVLCCTVSFAKSNPQPLDGIVAVVNDAAVTQSEVNEATGPIEAQMRNSNTPLPPANELRKKIVDQVIDRKLQLQAAEQAGIKVSDTEVDQTINNIAQQNGMTPDMLYQKVETENLSRADYRKEIREELTLQQVQQQQVGSKITMTPDEVKTFMHSREWQAAAGPATPSVKEYEIKDVVILVPDAASAQDIALAKTRAETLFSQIKQGANENSVIKPDDKTIESNDLGWRKLDEIPSAFANQVAAAKPGSVIGPIQTGNGFHIVRLVDARQQKSAPVNATTPAPTEKEAQQMVYQRKFADALKKWIAKLHSQAVINLHPDSVA